MFTIGISPHRPLLESDFLCLYRGNEILVRSPASDSAVPTYGHLAALDGAYRGGGGDDIYVGRRGEDLCFARGLPDGDAAPPADGFSFTGLRTLLLSLEPPMAQAASAAYQLVQWRRNNRFCGRCAAPMAPKSDERAVACERCGHKAYPRISPAVIVAVLRDGRVLLARNRRRASPMFSIIAGFVEPGESLEQAVSREVLEETGLEVANVRYFGSQPWPFPDSLMIGFLADYRSGAIRLDEEELAEAGWYAPAEFPEIPPHGTISRRMIDWFRENTTR